LIGDLCSSDYQWRFTPDQRGKYDRPFFRTLFFKNAPEGGKGKGNIFVSDVTGRPGILSGWSDGQNRRTVDATGGA
jgi:hypothetical protein